MEEVVRKLVFMGKKIKFLSARMIRETTNATFPEYGFEEERKKYTVIGIPFYDLKNWVEDKTLIQTEIDKKIVEHIRTEYLNVENLIETIRNGENNERL